jgi:hypothetical protein
VLLLSRYTCLASRYTRRYTKDTLHLPLNHKKIWKLCAPDLRSSPTSSASSDLLPIKVRASLAPLHARTPPDHILTLLLLDLRYPALRAHYLQSNYGMTLWPCVFQKVTPLPRKASRLSPPAILIPFTDRHFIIPTLRTSRLPTDPFLLHRVGRNVRWCCSLKRQLCGALSPLLTLPGASFARLEGCSGSCVSLAFGPVGQPSPGRVCLTVHGVLCGTHPVC